MLGSVESNLEVEDLTSGNVTAARLYKAVSEFTTYIENNQGFIPNYGERYRNGERISTGFVESTVHWGEQTDGEETTDAMESARCASPAANTDQGA